MVWVQVAMMVAAMLVQERQQQQQQRKHQKNIRQLEEQTREVREAKERNMKARQEQQALKKRQAQIRARMGASGVGMGGGSGDAILTGLQQETRQNLLDFQSGFATNSEKELGRMKDSDGVSNGLKNIEKGIGYTQKINNNLPAD